MAFINPAFLGTQLVSTPSQTRPSRRTRHIVSSKLNRPNSDRFIFPSDNSGKKNRDYEPFDGSVPLLPPWRPPSVEADFAYNARRIVSRERAEVAAKKIVKVESDGCGTLFAEVVQEVGADGVEEVSKATKMWLRPLLLNSDVGGTFIDLRGGTDVVLEADKVSEIDAETKVRVSVNLAATECDVLERAVSDDRWNESGSKALLVFLKSLSSGTQ